MNQQKNHAPAAPSAQKKLSSSCETHACATPTHDEIAAHAYEIYVTKGSQPGHCKQNWQQAEYDLEKRQKAVATQAAGE